MGENIQRLSRDVGSIANPNPIVLEESELIVSEFLSPSKLQLITKSEKLQDVTSIEMIVNTSNTTLGNFGQYIPNLKQLKLNDSFIPSVRDIGTSLSGLTVLWMSRCSLNDVDGIASLYNLQELYVSFNNISDLSPISFLDSLEVLDLDNNEIKDEGQMDYLATMSCLTTLTLVGNPLVNTLNVQGNYRKTVIDKLPKLAMLDDAKTDILEDDQDKVLMDLINEEDMEMVSAAIKEGVATDTSSPKFNSSSNVNQFDNYEANSNEFIGRPGSANTLSLSDVNSRPNSAGSESGLQDEVSSLTIGPPICGNPISSLRNRRSKPSLIKFLNLNNSDRLNSKSNRRPTTAIGLQRPTTALGLQRQTVALQKQYDFESKNNSIDYSNKPRRRSLGTDDQSHLHVDDEFKVCYFLLVIF